MEAIHIKREKKMTQDVKKLNVAGRPTKRQKGKSIFDPEHSNS